MTLLMVLSLLGFAVAIALTAPVDLVRHGDDLEAEDWADDEYP